MKQKLVAIVLSVMMIPCFVAPATGVAFAEDEPAVDPPANEETLPEIQGDYYRQYMSTLYDSEIVACTSEAVEMSIDSKTKDLVFKGPQEELLAADIAFSKVFNFDGALVQRFSFDASAAKGQKVKLGFYLDESETPFTEQYLVKQRKKNTWEYSKECTVDVSDLNIVGEHTLSIKVLEASASDVSFEINWIEFVESSVPVVYFNIDETQGTIGEMNSSEDHSVECYGSMSIKVPEGYTSVDSGEVLEGVEDLELEYIRGRGNSTWDNPKHPYKLKLASSTNLLNMGKNKHWVLLANWYDNSLLRNRLTYWMGAQAGLAFTPDSEPVDVVMNGEYYGSYFLCEQVRVGKTRVDIKDLEDDPEATDEKTISGGYLLSMFPYHDESERQLITTKHDVEFLIENPEFEDYFNETQYNYIKNYIQSVEDAIYGEDFKNEAGDYYADLMDVASTAMYYWFQEFSMNGDGYVSGSTYLYKERDTKTKKGKLFWGPLWDFDFVAWGSTEYDGFDVQGWTQIDRYANWNGRLFEDVAFAQEVIDLWPQLKAVLTAAIEPGGQLDKYAANMEVTARYNFEKWGPTDFGGGWFDDDSEQPVLTYDQEIERFRSWISQRMTWVDAHVSELTPVETTVTFQTEDGQVIATKDGVVGRPLYELPEAPAKAGYTFRGWVYNQTITLQDLLDDYDCENEAELRKCLAEEGLSPDEIDEMINRYKEGFEEECDADEDTAAIENMVLTAQYVSNDEIVDVSSIIFSRDVYNTIFYDDDWIDELSLCYAVVPFDATFSNLTFSSDNESVATVDKYGYVTIKGAGDATITATASNGVTGTTRIHAYTEQEADDLGYSYESISVPEKMTLNIGKYRKLGYNVEYGVFYRNEEPSIYVTNPEVAEVESGVVHALKAGTTYILCNDNGDISICKLTVPPKAGAVGSVVTKNGLKYKVTVNSKKGGAVTCLGPVKKTLTKVTVPKTIKIGKKSYKVRTIKSKAFKGCKKLKTASIGANVTLIGTYAFASCPKLKTVKIYNSQTTIYKSSFKGISKKAVFKVNKKGMKYYKIVLKGKKIKKL